MSQKRHWRVRCRKKCAKKDDRKNTATESRKRPVNRLDVNERGTGDVQGKRQEWSGANGMGGLSRGAGRAVNRCEVGSTEICRGEDLTSKPDHLSLHQRKERMAQCTGASEHLSIAKTGRTGRGAAPQERARRVITSITETSRQIRGQGKAGSREAKVKKIGSSGSRAMRVKIR